MGQRNRKRPEGHFVDGNPFELPNSVSRGVRDAASVCHLDESRAVQYLWIHYSTKSSDGSSAGSCLTRDEWLGVIDEAVSMGVRLAVVSINESFEDVPDVISVAQWAQTTHSLMVGFHVHGRDVSRADARLLAKMDPELTRVFVEADKLDDTQFIEEMGIRVLPADGINEGQELHSCDLPKSMTCVISEGGLYTCGHVAGDAQYHMGNFLANKLRSVMNDDSVPHEVRGGIAHTPEQCSGCPPMMAQRIHEDAR